MESIEEEFYQKMCQGEVDRDFLLVYSDWLLKKGDSQGEIIALKCALAFGDRDKRQNVQEQLHALTQKRVKALDLPALALKKIKLTWTYGVVTKIRVHDKSCLPHLEKSILQTDQFKFLITLSLRDLGLKKLPEWVMQLSQLKELYLSYNNFEELPESLGKLSQLTDLDLSENNLTALPESLGQLSQLIDLKLYRNKLKKLPELLKNKFKLGYQRY